MNFDSNMENLDKLEGFVRFSNTNLKPKPVFRLQCINKNVCKKRLFTLRICY